MFRRVHARVFAPMVLTLVVAATATAQDRAPRGHDDSLREKWQKVDEIFLAMGVKPGAVVADVGAGDGFFTTRLARAVGDEGRVFAVDINEKSLRRLRNRVEEEKLRNVEAVRGETDDPKLPEGSVDAVLIVNAYHEMREHQSMLAKIRAALKPGGRLVLVEPVSPGRRKSTRDAQAQRHEIGPDYVEQDAREAGFVVADLKDPFTRRHEGGDEEWLMVLVPAPDARNREDTCDGQ